MKGNRFNKCVHQCNFDVKIHHRYKSRSRRRLVKAEGRSCVGDCIDWVEGEFK
ncbi:hypothetical protein kac68v162_gp007 [Nodularia phage vB_NspS-kac68v162]|uniref:Uncharacterized protein n=2 Tax=Ravarandavirus kac68v161 TaxID=2845690 RepID=A0A482MJW9_9CAUD|nr:hypothetical protein HWC13_gp007 [Nodularia phage vB_NspS-kac68v161]QBQ73657.1 hypothetical protein kac68v161_gp007 [Nodularia phage vB_NspS-kac68v161]QBQ73855.1 hypothetical protein kac68v162_gp007 [Nodularia phage vB_NspS-kac68v162]